VFVPGALALVTVARQSDFRLIIRLLVINALALDAIGYAQSEAEQRLLASRRLLDSFRATIETETTKYDADGTVVRTTSEKAEYFVDKQRIRRSLHKNRGDVLVDIVSDDFYLSFTDTEYLDPKPLAEIYPATEAQQETGNFTISDPRFAGFGPYTVDQLAQASCRNFVGARASQEREVERVKHDGVDCVRVSYAGPHQSRISLVICPQQEYALLACESTAERNGINYRESVEIVNSRFSGIMFPKLVTISRFKNGVISSKSVEQIEMNSLRKSDEEVFLLRGSGMLPGQRVLNFIRGHEQVWNGEALETPSEILVDVDPPNVWRAAVLFGNLAILLGLVLLYRVRKVSAR